MTDIPNRDYIGKVYAAAGGSKEEVNMQCRIADLRNKEVINICSGLRLGFVCDVMFDIVSGKITAMVVPGPYKFLGLFGRSEDYVIPWEAIRKIGDDIILVETEERRREKRRNKEWL